MQKEQYYNTDNFYRRHIGPTPSEIAEMLAALNVSNLDDLIAETIPSPIRLSQPPDIGKWISEYDLVSFVEQLAKKNKMWRSYIGTGYYGTVTPPVIQRNIMENPGWYTQYTPYQAEIAQGRLEALLNFQTMVCDMTGMDVANASLLDEGTAAAEAMLMAHRIRNKQARRAEDEANRFLVANTCLPQTIAVLAGRAEPLGIELVVGDVHDFQFDSEVFGILLQYPTQTGKVEPYAEIVVQAKNANAVVVVAADLLSLALLTPPAEWGADIVVGSTQRFGVPMGYGGPHAAFFATSEEHLRQMPGRVIGVSIDKHGRRAYRMALQTREQHIRRDKATSNICTAQALLAIMASMYAVYHGAAGLRYIATKINKLTNLLATSLEKMGYIQLNPYYFDTLLIDLSQNTQTSGLRVRRVAELEEVNFRYFSDNPDLIGISLDETCSITDVARILRIFAQAANLPDVVLTGLEGQLHLHPNLIRTSEFLAHPVFNHNRAETEMVRYIKQLEKKDLSLTHAMIPLGSCTMKLNPTSALMPVTLPEFGQLHPFVPIEQAEGYHQIMRDLAIDLCKITGFEGCSLQPNSGAQGEYAGLMVIRAYHIDHHQPQRKVALIPQSAHGTNPASAVMAGMEVVVVKCDSKGNIDLDDLRAKAEQHSHTLACLMVTYPSTHGVFEAQIRQVCQIIHEHDGLVYMDGANMNAQVGLTSPAAIGADLCHLNLHKTFSIPHGGGGPGMGPICVAKHLVPYLPGHFQKHNNTSKAIQPISSAPFGSASILLISYAYLRLLGTEGVMNATKIAILNANYAKKRLEQAYNVLYVGDNDRVAHELILDFRPFKHTANIEVEDVAKRLMDYGYHAPTVSFPVAGTLMIEPTESESKAEIDRFCDALLAIRVEIAELETGAANSDDNVLKNAPHTIYELTANDWQHAYSREKAAYPLPYLLDHKFWTPVGRINNTYGDKNVVCTCPPLDAYAN